jgi:hypothetical protein
MTTYQPINHNQITPFGVSCSDLSRPEAAAGDLRTLTAPVGRELRQSLGDCLLESDSYRQPRRALATVNPESG